MMMSPDHRPSASEYVRKVLEPLTTSPEPSTTKAPFKLDYLSPSCPYNQPLDFVKKKLKARRRLDVANAEAMSPNNGGSLYRSLRVRPVSERQYKRWSQKTYVQSKTPATDDIIIHRWPECKRHIAGPPAWRPTEQRTETLGPLLDELQDETNYDHAIVEAEAAFSRLKSQDEPEEVIHLSPAEIKAIHDIRSKLIRAMATCYSEFGAGEEVINSTADNEDDCINTVAARLADGGLQRFSYNSPSKSISSDHSHFQHLVAQSTTTPLASSPGTFVV